MWIVLNWTFCLPVAMGYGAGYGCMQLSGRLLHLDLHLKLHILFERGPGVSFRKAAQPAPSNFTESLLIQPALPGRAVRGRPAANLLAEARGHGLADGDPHRVPVQAHPRVREGGERPAVKEGCRAIGLRSVGL